jgi:hypothetical protein
MAREDAASEGTAETWEAAAIHRIAVICLIVLAQQAAKTLRRFLVVSSLLPLRKLLHLRGLSYIIRVLVLNEQYRKPTQSCCLTIDRSSEFYSKLSAT